MLAKDGVVFARDQVFTSTAAVVVLGRAANGRKERIETTNQLSYGEWQDRELIAPL
ncbi:DUF4357 domain-containing protein [Paeniglutamicibacter sp.]|uniref:DUF4357 domain-containing protein n=1 Tax=Paeniglutamicibacter sp. TaxID=1934391 RepID=UPI003988A9E4